MPFIRKVEVARATVVVALTIASAQVSRAQDSLADSYPARCGVAGPAAERGKYIAIPHGDVFCPLIADPKATRSFVIYQRGGTNAYVATFAIVAGNGIDRVTHTDGIDVSNFGLGSPFAQGVFVAQDGFDESARNNYKLVRWQDIANAVSPALTIDTSWDPRQICTGWSFESERCTHLYLPLLVRI